jgi:hypothetical protein
MAFRPAIISSIDGTPRQSNRVSCYCVPLVFLPSVCSIQHDPRTTIEELTPLIRIRIRPNLEMIWVDFQNLELALVTSNVLRPYSSADISVRDCIRVQLCRERAPVPNYITCETRVGTLRRGSCEEWTRSGVNLCSSIEDKFVNR